MSNEKEIEKQEKVKMPWQGKVWIGYFILGLVAFTGLLVYIFFSSNSSYQDKEFFIWSGPLAILFILSIIFGLIQRWKWLVKTYLVIGLYNFYENIKNVLKGVFKEDFYAKEFLIDLIYLAISIFFLYLIYLAISIFFLYLIKSYLEHPYFNQKKLKNNSVKI